MYILLFLVALSSYVLYGMINKWYIEPYKDLVYRKSLDDIEYKTIIESKNQLINKMTIEIEELKAKSKESKKKSTKKVEKKEIKDKIVVKVKKEKKPTKKILEKFEIKNS